MSNDSRQVMSNSHQRLFDGLYSHLYTSFAICLSTYTIYIVTSTFSVTRLVYILITSTVGN